MSTPPVPSPPNRGITFCVRAPVEEVRAALQVSSLEGMAKAKAPDPSVFDTYPPAYWRAQISNSNVDSYITRMATSSLKNYAADANAGVPFQPSHDIFASSLGASLTGTYTGKGGDGIEKVHSDFYGIQGVDPAADMFFAKARAGIAPDVSIGFGDGTMNCSICDAPAYRFLGFTFSDCEHVPGLEYDSGKGQKQMAFLWCNDMHLYEVSTVADGATPGAGIVGMKAQMMADAGRLRPQDAVRLESRFAIRIAGSGHRWPGATPERRDADTGQRVPAAPRKERSMDLATELRALLAEFGGDADADPLEHVRSILTERKATRLDLARAHADAEKHEELMTATRNRLAEAEAELERLRPEADAGRKFRETVIEDALKSGVRAMGDKFDRDRYSGMFQRMSVDEIRLLQEDWERTAKQRFPGGRTTNNGDEAPPARTSSRVVPIRASRS